VRESRDPVTSGYSDGRVAAELAASAVSIVDATCSPRPRQDVHVGIRRFRRAKLIDCEEGRTLRTVLVGMLRESDR